jgi:hypothetical protein
MSFETNLEIKLCPTCASPNVAWEYTCHTYLIEKTWMACQPCDSAVRYLCCDCDWSYTDGLNPGNPRTVQNAGAKPVWLNEAARPEATGVESWVVPGIRCLWD